MAATRSPEWLKREWDEEGLAASFVSSSDIKASEVSQKESDVRNGNSCEPSMRREVLPQIPELHRPAKREHEEEDPEAMVSIYNGPYSSLNLAANHATFIQRSMPNASSTPRESSPARSSTGSLTEAGTATPPIVPNSAATAFMFLNGVVPPPKKRVKLTYAEKEEKRILKEVRERERADEKARKEAERREKEDDKARREAAKETERRQKESEREAKRLIKEAEDAEKDQKRKSKDEEKRKKEEERRRKEDEKQKLEDEKKQKERSQLRLNAFFKTPAASKENVNNGGAASPPPSISSPDVIKEKSPNKGHTLSEYEKTFLPFFIQRNVTVAPITYFERDSQATEALQQTIDGYITGNRSPSRFKSFDPSQLFKTPDLGLQVRGRRFMAVRDIMSQAVGRVGKPIDLTTESQNAQIRNTRKLLSSVPYKVLKFSEDIRPPYMGTYSKQPASSTKLARNFRHRDLPNVDYDYDSEEDWEPPGEDDEEILSEGDDEEEGDGDEDMDEFLDDAEDTLVNAKKVIQSDLEPKSTGLCWENQNRRGPNLKLYGYVMEILHENPEFRTPIDPYTTRYWDPPIPPQKHMEPPRAPLAAIKGTNAGVNGSNTKPVKMFGAVPKMNPTNPALDSSKAQRKMIGREHMAAFKQAVQSNHDLSKLGLVEVLNKQFPKHSKAAIKGTLETYFQRHGAKEVDKRWVYVEEELQ